MPAEEFDTPATVEHEAAGLVIAVMEQLARGELLSTAELGTRVGASRDTARRILRTLAGKDWARAELADGREVWSIGPELPRLGHAYTALLVRRAAALRADYDRATAPLREGA